MIRLQVDEAYAFDYLAILQVKQRAGLDVGDAVTTCIDDLVSQLGKLTTYAVIDSEEYKALVDANRETFYMVDKAKDDQCLASDVDRANHKRYTAKRELQRHWFSKTITEVKTERQYDEA